MKTYQLLILITCTLVGVSFISNFSPAPNTERTVAVDFLGPEMDEASKRLAVDKLFSLARKPSKVIPFFHSRHVTANSSVEEVTVVLHITIERWDNFLRTASRLETAISAVVHIKSKNEHSEAAVKTLEDIRQSIKQNEDLFRRKIDLHVVIDIFPRQFNYWRNVARLYARTDYIFMLDVDFAIMSPIHEITSNPMYKAMLKEGNTALLLPAFEFHRGAKRTTVNDFPTDKGQVKSLLKEKKMILFHGMQNPGHRCIGIKKWVEATEAYSVPCWAVNFEPYGVFNRHTVPWCDERFVGYGKNKISCWFELYLSGVEMKVLPDQFAIHQYHDYPNKIRTSEVCFLTFN